MPEETEDDVRKRGMGGPSADDRTTVDSNDESLGGFFSFPLTLLQKCADPYSCYSDEPHEESQGEPGSGSGLSESAIRAVERDFEVRKERLEEALRRTEALHEETKRALAEALHEHAEPRCRPEALYARALQAYLTADLRTAGSRQRNVLEGALAKLEALNYSALEKEAQRTEQQRVERDMLEMRRSAEQQGLKAAAAARVSMEVELGALRARLGRSAEEVQRSRAEAEALREEILRLEADTTVLAGAKRELEEGKAWERSNLMAARSELEDLTARLSSAQAAAEASEEARRRLKDGAAKEAAAARKAEELLGTTGHERDALVDSHAELGSMLVGLLKALMSLDAEVQQNLYVGTQCSNADIDISANSSELHEMHLDLSGAHKSVVEGLQEAVSRLRVAPLPAESLLGQQGSGLREEQGNGNGAPGHQGPQEEEAAEEERAGAVARLHASMVAAEALVAGLQGKLRCLDGRTREVVQLEDENSELMERLAGAEEVMEELREETAAAAGMFVEARETQEAEGMRIREAEARMAEREAELLDEIASLREQKRGWEASAAADEGLALVALAAQESLEDAARRSREEAESARILASQASEARVHVEDLLQRFRDAARSHAELEKNNNLIHGSVEGLVDVVNDLKRMNGELVQENEALAVDRERLLLLEGRCEELEGMLRTAGVLEEGLLGTDEDFP